MLDFAAIDFETANECRSSVCSVGIVIVRDGAVVETFYRLIRPAPDYYLTFNTQIHGLWPPTPTARPGFRMSGRSSRPGSRA